MSEFVSDAFDACDINQEDLRKEMEQLVLDKKDGEFDNYYTDLTRICFKILLSKKNTSVSVICRYFDILLGRVHTWCLF